MAVEIIAAPRSIIGEAPTWSAAEKALYWIDVKAPSLSRRRAGSREITTWMLPADIGAFALIEGGQEVIVALRTGLHKLDLSNSGLELIAPAPFDPRYFRFNEGACDPAGRFFIGVMFDPVDGAGGAKQLECLRSFTLDGGMRDEEDRAELHNGMAWSPGGRTFYLSHTPQREVFAFDYDPDQGRLGQRRSFIKIPEMLGVPDGAAVDIEGGYWCALYGSGVLHRYDTTGTLTDEIELPVEHPTKCAFAGEDLEVMYVTSACDDLDLLNKDRLAGSLLQFRPRILGLHRNCYVR